jgi:hypothetical protein
MLFLSMVRHYFVWHYSRALSEIFHIWLNFLWFTIHFFSIPQLIRSWFAPWKRITADRGKRWSFEDMAGYVIIGLLTRLIGFIIRTSIIATGLIALFFVIIGGLIVYVIWIAIPIIMIALTWFGLIFLIA